MGILQILGLLSTILFKLPKLIVTIVAIIRLVRSMKDKDLAGDLEVLGEILKLILSLIGLDKTLAVNSLNTLKSKLENKEDLKSFKDKLEEEKKKCEGSFCPADLK